MTLEDHIGTYDAVPQDAPETPVKDAGSIPDSVNNGVQTDRVVPRQRGGQRHNKNSRVHGMSAVEENWQRRRPMDRRTRSGRVETEALDAFVKAYRRQLENNPKLMLQIRLTCYDAARQDEQARLHRKAVKEIPGMRKSPKALHLLNNYEQPVVNSLREDLKALPEPDRDSGETLESVVADIIREQQTDESPKDN